MRKITAVILGVSALLSSPLWAANQRTFAVKGMVCAPCEKQVTKALNTLEGVKVLSVSAEKGMAIVEVQEGVNLSSEKIQTYLKEKSGFSAKEIVLQKKSKKQADKNKS